VTHVANRNINNIYVNNVSNGSWRNVEKRNEMANNVMAIINKLALNIEENEIIEKQ